MPIFSTLPITQAVANPTATATLPVTQSVTDEAAATLPMRQAVTSCATASSGYWTVAVTLAGADVSARLTGTLSITAEESAARIAEFRLSPATGAIDPTAWVGAAVTIDYGLTDGAGTTLFTARRFTGRVDVPEYNPIDRTVLFRCTDGLQSLLEAADRTTIDALTPGALVDRRSVRCRRRRLPLRQRPGLDRALCARSGHGRHLALDRLGGQGEPPTSSWARATSSTKAWLSAWLRPATS